MIARTACLAVVLVLVVALPASAQPGATPPNAPPGATPTPLPDAQPPPPMPSAPSAPPPVTDDPSLALREANAAANAGDWARVSAFVEPLLTRQLEAADLAEAHRLAGIAAWFAQPQRLDLADQHFLAYLRIDLDGHLDPALYPPPIITFFADVRSRHAAELRARRPKAKRSWIPALLPPWGQFNNGERTKGVVVGVLLGTFLAANVTSYLVLRGWCFKQSRDGHESVGCDATTDRNQSAATLRSINITAGVGLIVTYVWGVYDGVRGYRRSRREGSLAPYATSTNTGATIGVSMNF